MHTVIAREIVNARFGNISQGLERRMVEQASSDETFELVDNGDGTWSLKSPSGDEWVSILEDGTIGSRRVSELPQPQGWEKFTRHGNILTEAEKPGVTRPLVELVTQ